MLNAQAISDLKQNSKKKKSRFIPTSICWHTTNGSLFIGGSYSQLIAIEDDFQRIRIMLDPCQS